MEHPINLDNQSFRPLVSFLDGNVVKFGEHDVFLDRILLTIEYSFRSLDAFDCGENFLLKLRY